MSAGGSGAPAAGSVSDIKLLVIGIVGAFIGIYLSSLGIIGDFIAFNISGTVGIILAIIGRTLACLGGVCAIVWGANAIRSVASYGLGTGVPSIGYMSLSIGIIGAIAGLVICTELLHMAILGPIIGFLIAVIFGVIVGAIGIYIIGMKIPIMIRCTAEIGGAAALSVIAFAAAIAGTFSLTMILTTVVATGFIAVLLIMNTMAVQHPFNACLGPNEDQSRTLALAKATGFLSMVIVGILALLVGDIISCFVVIIVGLILWYISFRKFVKMSYDAAASVRWTGLWPKVEE